MDQIFHEKQEGSLCAQHCLNALLQGPYFTAVDLGTLAQSLDDEERITMAESGIESEEYQRFLAQPSGNMDDSGYFSVQVISRALQVWGLDLLPYNSTAQEALQAQQCPSSMSAFICNYRDHWFSIRKLGSQWFNLNSLLSKPQLISDTYLAMFLAQLQQEGYSIFIVRGNLPGCRADSALAINPYVPPPAARTTPGGSASAQQRPASGSDDDEEELKAVLALSLAEIDSVAEKVLQRGVSSEDEELQKALALSLGVETTSQTRAPVQQVNSPDEEDAQLQAALALSLGVQSEQQANSSLTRPISIGVECSSNSNTGESSQGAQSVDPEEVRRKRLAFLDSTKSS